MAVSTASVVLCSKCGHRTVVYACRKRDNAKVRYRKCPNCEHRMCTTQDKTYPNMEEKPYVPLPPEERIKRARARRTTKLDEQAVKEIKYLWHNKINTYRDLALAYDVHYETIRRAVKRGWADVETPRSLTE